MQPESSADSRNIRLEKRAKLAAWNRLSFTMFQDFYPEATNEQVQAPMMQFSQLLFDARSR